jgi:hypothetical protein
MPGAVRRQREMIALYKRVRRHFTHSDFYALTPAHWDRTKWVAWQFYCPEDGEGALQFFRHNGAPEDRLTVRLQALKPEAVYEFEDGRSGEKREMTGREAMDGFTQFFPKPRMASVWIYHEKKD